MEAYPFTACAWAEWISRRQPLHVSFLSLHENLCLSVHNVKQEPNLFLFKKHTEEEQSHEVQSLEKSVFKTGHIWPNPTPPRDAPACEASYLRFWGLPRLQRE